MLKTPDTTAKGESAAMISIIAIAIIGTLKGIIGYQTSSVSLMAQAIDSITDLFALIAVFLGLRISKKAPSKRFQYGYYRVETLVSLIVASLIILTGIQILRESITRILSPEHISYPIFALIVAGGSIPILLMLYRYMKKIGREINSMSLQSQAADFKADMYSSIMVMIGVLSYTFGYPWVEGIVGSLISLFVLKTGLSQGWLTLLILMDAVTEPERLDDIRTLTESVRGVREVERVRVRQSGPYSFGELYVKVDKRIPVDQAHRITDEIEEKVMEKYPFIESIVIHIEPVEEDKKLVAIPVQEDKGLDSAVSPHFGEAPFFIIIDIETAGKGVKKWFMKQNHSYDLDKKRGINTVNLLLEEDVTTLVVKQLGEGPFHYLRDSFIEIFKYEGEMKASEAINQLMKTGLEIMKNINSKH